LYSVFGYQLTVSSTTEEIVKVYEALPADKQAELADFARFLLARYGVEDQNWSRFSAGHVAKAFGSSEPDYSKDDLKP
jgi:hypothetical protein